MIKQVKDILGGWLENFEKFRKNNNFQPVVQIYHVDYPINNLSEMSSGYFYNNENALINSVTARVAFKSSEDILCVVGVNTQGSAYPVTANIKIAITAQFPD